MHVISPKVFFLMHKYLIRYDTCTSSFYLRPVRKTVSYCLSGRLSFAPQKLRLLFCEHDGYWYSSTAIVGVMAAAVAEVFNPFLVLAKLLLIAFLWNTLCEKVRYAGLIILEEIQRVFVHAIKVVIWLLTDC